MGEKIEDGSENSKKKNAALPIPTLVSAGRYTSWGSLELHIDYVALKDLRAYRRNAKKHPTKQLKKLGQSLQEFGFVTPVLVDENNTVIAGHARCLVANQLGLEVVPVVRLAHLTPPQVKALRIADNRLSELGEWDKDLLAVEIAELLEVNFDVDLTGFEAPQIDMMLDTQLDSSGDQAADALPIVDTESPSISRVGDLWCLGHHFLLCGDARQSDSYCKLMRGELAQIVVTDPPYNVPIHGHVAVAGDVHKREFVMASGEMSPQEFIEFLFAVVRCLARYSLAAALQYIFMDWRSLSVLDSVCRDVFARQVNLCVWAKTNGGMGSLYRSQHELVTVYQNGSGPHINNVQLGKHGRNRTNVWHYEGVNSLNRERRAELRLHPTVKPCEMIADVLRDASERNGIVLDPFVGSGTTIIASEITGRRCRAMELDPRYVDVAIKRWQDYTGEVAVDASSGLTFAETKAQRCPMDDLPPGYTEVEV